MKGLRMTATVLSAGFWMLVVAVPIGVVLMRGVSVGGLLDPDVLYWVRVTGIQAVASTVLSVGVGLPLGLWIRGGRTAEALLAVPFGIPTVVAAMSWIAWLGYYSWGTVVLAHVFFNVPWMALLISQARRGVDEAGLAAARTLGAGAWLRFSAVVWPEIRWTVASGAVQVFSVCVMSFALVLLLGGGPPVETLETAIYSRVRYSGADFSGAAAIGLWQMGLTLLPWIGVVMLRRRLKKLPKSGTFSGVRPLDPSKSSAFRKFLGAAVWILPYLIVLKGVGTFPAGSEWGPAFLNSVLLAGGSAVLTCFFACAAVYAGRGRGALWEVLAGLPGGISALVLGLGFYLAYARWIDPFEGSRVAMILLQTALFFPIAYRVFWGAAQGVNGELITAARSLGASPLRAFWTVEGPRWTRLAGAVGVMVAGASLGEVAAVSLFSSERLMTLPLLQMRWMGQYRFQEAQAVAALLLVVSGGMIFAAVRGLGREMRWS